MRSIGIVMMVLSQLRRAQAFLPTPPHALVAASATSSVNPAVIFFSGANARMPKTMYSDFLDRMQKNNFTIYDAAGLSEKKLDDVVNEALQTHSEVSLLSHSLGSAGLLRAANFHSSCKKIVMLDPVRSLNDEGFYLKHCTRALMVRATKAHEWKARQGVPFLLGFNLQPHHVTLRSDAVGKGHLTVIDAKGFGHGDICDTAVASTLHYTNLGQGFEDRDHVDEYRQWVADVVANFINTPDDDMHLNHGTPPPPRDDPPFEVPYTIVSE